eukprot:6198-Heterococcus_DN1.PRE.4
MPSCLRMLSALQQQPSVRPPAAQLPEQPVPAQWLLATAATHMPAAGRAAARVQAQISNRDRGALKRSREKN